MRKSCLTFCMAGMVLTVVIGSVVRADTPYWDTNWNYRQQVAITNSVEAVLYDYSMKIGLDTAELISQGKMQSDCGDIRVIENGVEISYGITDPNSASTEIYFIANDLIAGINNDIYIYYGNPDAGNGFVENWKDAFYIWYDDFDTDRGWYDYWDRGVSWTISNGELSVYFSPYQDGAIAPADGSSFPMDGRVGIKTEARMKVLNNRWCQAQINLSWQYPVHDISVGHSRYSLAFSNLISKSLSTDTWYVAETVYNRLTGDWYGTFDGDLITGNRPALESDDLSTIMIACCNGTAPVVDYIYLRYFIKPEPAYVLGPEEYLPEPIERILDFIEDSIADETLAPVKEGKPGQGQLGAFINMIEAAGNLIEADLPVDACIQLHDALEKTDGLSPPESAPDFVAGEAAAELANMIEDLMAELGC